MVDLYHQILLLIIHSPNTTKDKPQVSYLHKIEVIWKLAFIFEYIMLSPIEQNTQEGTSKQIQNRIHLMRRGKTKQVYEQSRKCTSMTPEEKATKNNTESSTHKFKCAQIAADNDQFRSAIARVNNNTPVALNTNETIKILSSLYSKKHILEKEYNRTKKIKITNKNLHKRRPD